MGGRDARHASPYAFWLPVALVLGLIAAAGGVLWLAPPGDDPADTAPTGLELAEPAQPAAVATPASGTADPAKVRRAVAGLLGDRDLGPHVLAEVAGLDGVPLYTRGDGVAIPASTLKLLTAVAALDAMGPDRTFATTVVADGPGRIVLVGGGDPLLASTRPARDAYPRPADVVTLARQAARALQESGTTQVRVGYDATLFTGPDVNAHWPASYVPDGVVAPIQALWVDEGRPDEGTGRVDDPARAAAAAFSKALRRAGIDVVGAPTQRTADSAAAELARVTSPPLWQVVEHTVAASDNEAAEVLARHVALAAGEPATFEAGAAAVLRSVADLGVDVAGATTYDGSGLSRDNRLAPETLTDVLDVAGAAEHPALRAVITGLPVAGFTGSLAIRFEDDTLGRGTVRAKTGTLTGVSGLAGTVVDRTGVPLTFVLLADDVALADTLDAREALDDVAAALAACSCAA